MIEALLRHFCGKNSRKKAKIRQILNTIRQEGDEFHCKSSSSEKLYNIFYSSKKKKWYCNCTASIYNKYEVYETLEDRKHWEKERNCIHIIACQIWLANKKGIFSDAPR